MMARTLQRVLSNDLGFEYEQSGGARGRPCGAMGSRRTAARDYWDEVKGRVAQHPEVAAVALALTPPLGGRVHEEFVEDVRALEVVLNRVEPAYLRA